MEVFREKCRLFLNSMLVTRHSKVWFNTKKEMQLVLNMFAEKWNVERKKIGPKKVLSKLIFDFPRVS